MKTTMKTTLSIVILLLSFQSFSQDFEKLSDEKVKDEIPVAKKFGDEFLKALQKNQTSNFKDEVTELFKTTFTSELQKSLSSTLKEQVGTFKESDYVETWKDKSGFKIFRFKGSFTKSNKKVEIRTVLDENNKVAGFFVKPWSDILQ